MLTDDLHGNLTRSRIRRQYVSQRSQFHNRQLIHDGANNLWNRGKADAVLKKSLNCNLVGRIQGRRRATALFERPVR